MPPGRKQVQFQLYDLQVAPSTPAAAKVYVAASGDAAKQAITDRTVPASRITRALTTGGCDSGWLTPWSTSISIMAPVATSSLLPTWYPARCRTSSSTPTVATRSP